MLIRLGIGFVVQNPRRESVPNFATLVPIQVLFVVLLALGFLPRGYETLEF